MGRRRPKKDRRGLWEFIEDLAGDVAEWGVTKAIGSIFKMFD